MRQFLEELKRRNVIRVGVAYVVAAWVLLQVADLVLDNIGAPDWVIQAFMLALALGFPLVLIFAWVFEMTPEGLKLEKDVVRAESVTAQTAKKLDRLTIALLLLVLVVVGADRLLPDKGAQPDASPTAENVAPAGDPSIAVLAFDDLSPDGDQDYFATGIAEEILNALAQVPELKVAGRTSSFAFKGQQRDLREIGRILGVAHILEGSVRKAGNDIRVTAQLIKADDGFHLFSETYGGDLDDIFAVQDDIAGRITSALTSVILGEDPTAAVTPTDPQAYSLYLLARQHIHTRDKTLMTRATELLDEAIAIDPRYAPAYAQKALAVQLLSNSPGSYGDTPEDVALRVARPLIDRALELDPDLAEAHAVLGLWYSNDNSDPAKTEAALLRALELNPHHANAQNWLANEYVGHGREAEARELFEQIVDHDPLYGPAFNNLIFVYAQTNDLDKAVPLVERVEAIAGKSDDVYMATATIALFEGRLADAIVDLRQAYDFNPSATIVRVFLGIALRYAADDEAAAEMTLASDRLAPLARVGRHEEASEVFKRLNSRRRLIPYEYIGLAEWFFLDGRHADYARFLTERYGSGDEFIERLPALNGLWGATQFLGMAHAFDVIGEPEHAARLIAHTRRLHEDQAANGADNPLYWHGRAELAAHDGDADAMVQYLERAVATGDARVRGFDSPYFDAWREHPGFVAIEARTKAVGRAARVALGLSAEPAPAQASR